MGFFEALKKKVYSKWSRGKALYMSDDWKFGRDAGINAMIKGLKETIVGKPIICDALSITRHTLTFYSKTGGEEIGWLHLGPNVRDAEEIGADAEEVSSFSPAT